MALTYPPSCGVQALCLCVPLSLCVCVCVCVRVLLFERERRESECVCVCVRVIFVRLNVVWSFCFVQKLICQGQYPLLPLLANCSRGGEITVVARERVR